MKRNTDEATKLYSVSGLLPTGTALITTRPFRSPHHTISKLLWSGTVQSPASFILVASMNPRVCGYTGDLYCQCAYSATMVRKYQQRISGPLLDRIDLHLDLPRLAEDELVNYPESEKSSEIRKRVRTARDRHLKRYKGRHFYCNAQIGPREIKEFCVLAKEVRALLREANQRLSLSARLFDRILKVSRTIGDLAGVDDISVSHVAEAIQYRSLDRQIAA